MRLIVSALLLALLGGCSGPASRDRYVILISFDGFRHDYIERFDLQHFEEFKRTGASAEALIPSFPSKTFPNHYSIVTGLSPGHHGIVANKFYDKTKGILFDMHIPEMVRDSSFFLGTPLWTLAERHGLKSASVFWPGSEARRPTYYLDYNEDMDNDLRIDQVLAWLQLPEKERPRFVSLYFSFVDTQGHNFGPGSEELKEAVMEADRLLGRLMDQLKQISFDGDVVITSDHGMSTVKRDSSSYIVLADVIPQMDTTIRVINSGSQASFYCDDCDSLYEELKSTERQFGYRVLKRNEFPRGWNYDNPLAGDFLMVADSGKQIAVTRNILSWIAKQEKVTYGGEHGFDPATVSDMNGIFLAKGPDIKPGVTIPACQNVDVYPFVAILLGLKAPATDGSAESTKSILK